MGGKWSISQEGLNTPAITADIIFCIQWVISSQALADYIRKAPQLDPRASYFVHLMAKKFVFTPLWNLVRQHAFWCNRRISVCLHRKTEIKKNKNTELRKSWSPEEVIKSKNVKSILVKKVLHKVFWRKTNFCKVSKHSGACILTFDVALTIKTHSCSFISTTAALQII